MRRQRGVLWTVLAALLAVVMVVLPSSANATTPFDDEQGSAIREGLEITGGYAERFALDADGETVYMATHSPQGLWSWDGSEWTNPAANSNVDVGSGYNVVPTDVEGTALMTAGRSVWITEDYGVTITEGADEDWDNTVLEFRTGEQMLYGANGQGQLLKSDDYGQTVEAYDVSGNQDDRLWSIGWGPEYMWALSGEQGGDSTLYYSDDAGVTWTAGAKTGEYTIMNVRESDGLIVMASREAVEYCDGSSADCEDAGATWTDSGHPEATLNSHISFYGSTVYVGPFGTTDMSTWATPYPSATSESNLQINQLLIAGDDVWTTCFGAPCYSDDAGVTFQDAREELYAQTVGDIAQGTDKDTVVLGLLGGISISTDFYTNVSAGTQPTWSDLEDPSGQGNISGVEAVFVDQDDDDIMMAAFNSELWRTDDGGTTWSEATDVDLEETARGQATDIYQDPNSGNIYLAWSYYEGDLDATLTDDVGGGVYKSEDQGETWTALGIANVPANVVVTDDRENILVGVGYEWEEDTDKRGLYLYKTRVGAWVHLTSASTHTMYDTVVRDAIFIDGLSRYIAVTGETDEGGVYRSGPMYKRAKWSMMGTSGNNTLPSDFWGTAIVDDPSGTNRVLVAHSRPSATEDSVATIYACYPGGIGCVTYYEGYRDERILELLFDGLLAGTNAGFAQLEAKAEMTLVKKLIKNGDNAGKVRLTAMLTDAASGAKLNGRVVKYYKKTPNGKWRYAGQATVEKGKARIWVPKRAKNNIYKAQWKPRNDVDVEAYTSDKAKSNLVTVKKNKNL